MRTTKTAAWLVCLLLFLFLGSSPVFANETSVEIDTVSKAQKGEEVSIKLNVSHEGNNFIHYTYEVYLSINGEREKEWKFYMLDRPPSEEFSKEITYTVDRELELEAKGYCTLHGSNNTARATIQVEQD